MMKLVLTGCLVWLAAASTLLGQNRITLVDVYQEVEQLRAQVGRLQLELEAQKRENENMRRSLEAMKQQQQSLIASYNQFVTQTNSTLGTLPERERVLKTEIFAEMTRQMKDLADQVQRGFDQLTKTRSYTEQQSATVTFDQDYPSTGVAYVVQPGDSLSKIAQKLNSTVRDIQNANQIRDPSRDLRAGDTIFVPQRNP